MGAGEIERVAFYAQSQTQNFLLLYSLLYLWRGGGGESAVMETAPCNDTARGSIIIMTIMGLDGIAGGQVGVLRAP